MSRIFSIIVGIIIVIVLGIFILSIFGIRLPFFVSTKKVHINGHIYTVEVAKTEKEQHKGLSGRNKLDTDQVMLFLFDKADYLQFWMKDMKFPIDIIFIKDENIVTVIPNAPIPTSSTDVLTIYQPTEPANKVLEIPAGDTAKYNIKPGDAVMVE